MNAPQPIDTITRPAIVQPLVAFEPLESTSDVAEAWSGLSTAVIEPNIFHHPRLLVPLATQLGGRIELATVRAGGDLLAAVPIRWARLGFGVAGRLPQVLAHDLGPLGTPWLDGALGPDAVDALLAALALRAPAVVLPDLPIDGPAARVVLERAAAAGHDIRVLAQAPRAVLRTGLDPETFLSRNLDKKRRKEWARQMRRLTEKGEVRHETARGPDDVAAAFAAFLDLERTGWKGRARTALAFRPALASSFGRIITALAVTGGAEIDRLVQGERTVAALITLRQGDRAWTWKTAYDEALASHSPGVLLTIEVTRRLLSEPGIALVDSLAVSNHPMIDHIWPDRMEIATVMIGLSSMSPRPALAARDFALHAALKARAKRYKAELASLRR